MSAINHPSVAKLRQEGVHEWQLFEGSTDATNLAAILDAQVEATLALVYEQRTANLIAAFSQLNSGEDESLLGERMDGLELAKEIKERLDFK